MHCYSPLSAQDQLELSAASQLQMSTPYPKSNTHGARRSSIDPQLMDDCLYREG